MSLPSCPAAPAYGDGVAPDRDKQYIDLLLGRLRLIKNYQPKMGKGSAVTAEQFISIYGDDPLYHWVGFDSPLMYAAHKAAGSMTSLYRNLGTGCEHLFKQVLRDQLGLTEADIVWTYKASSAEIESFAGVDQTVIDPDDAEEIAGLAEDLEASDAKATAKGKQNTLDGRFDLASIKNADRREAAAGWAERVRQSLGISWDPVGAVFEVRQGYKSMDSKRQAADIANAAQALTKARLPVLVVMSRQIDPVLVTRYQASKWALLRGSLDDHDPTTGTFAFFKDVLDYDLVKFFERNAKAIRSEMDEILRSILGTDS